MQEERNDSTSRTAYTEVAERFREAMTVERKALRDLLREHRELHEQNLELVRQLVEQPDGTGEIEELKEAIEKNELRFNLLRAENTELVDNYQKMLVENNNLFKLYIASHRLHSSLIMDEVLEVISEIILNLVGAESYSIFFHDESARQLVPVLVRGIERELVPVVDLGEGPVGQAVTTSTSYVLVEQVGEEESAPDHPLVVIPLTFRDRLLGGIALYRLLSHKHELRDVDYALFDYLATHAAMALHSAKLYSEAEKKVSKMKEFLNLMQMPGQGGAGDGDRVEGGVGG
jgi:hypothetical protein